MNLPNNTLLQGGKYRIIRFISSGGFGCTYEAEHTMLKKHVAIKEFFVKTCCNRDENTAHVTVGTQSQKPLVAKLRNKFIDEARAVCQLHHPNIVNVSDIFEENGTAYYVMDYIDGRSLSDIVNHEGPLTEARALKYIRQIASALQYVHDHNLLHLDVKPGNIMVDSDDIAVLIDFGASKQYDEESGENTSTLMGKTPGYAPLEQMGNDVRKFTPATDIYALGATLYKLLSGVTPLSSTDLAGGEELAPLPTSVSVSVAHAIAAAMNINKTKRPQTMKEFLSLLNATQTSEETIFPASAESIGQPISGDDFQANGITFKMMKVEEGTFRMGATSEQQYPDSAEKPVHQVTLSTYYIGETAVTQALWKAVMGENPSHFQGDNLPVENVSWNDCQKFISKLNEITGQFFRLPTEAEWEFAARGGNNSRRYQYSGSNTLVDVAWYKDNSDNQTHSVKTKRPNELGIYDMSGNVWEWCQDWNGSYSSASVTNPTGAATGTNRVYRGGSWNYYLRNCRTAFRGNFTPDWRNFGLGFRLAL
jgi:formylglycine-generating enzyme required for sulfatase activity